SLVRERRAGRLKADDAALFSGEFWTGRQALDLGLVDGLGDLRTILRQRFGERVRLRVVGRQQSRLRLLLGRTRTPSTPAESIGDWPDRLLGALEARAMWARLGL